MGRVAADSDASLSRLHDVKAVSELLGVSPKTVYALVWRGDLGHYRVGRRYRFSQSHVRAFLEAAEEGSGPEPPAFVRRW